MKHCLDTAPSQYMWLSFRFILACHYLGWTSPWLCRNNIMWEPATPNFIWKSLLRHMCLHSWSSFTSNFLHCGKLERRAVCISLWLCTMLGLSGGDEFAWPLVCVKLSLKAQSFYNASDGCGVLAACCHVTLNHSMIAFGTCARHLHPTHRAGAHRACPLSRPWTNSFHSWGQTRLLQIYGSRHIKHSSDRQAWTTQKRHTTNIIATHTVSNSHEACDQDYKAFTIVQNTKSTYRHIEYLKSVIQEPPLVDQSLGRVFICPGRNFKLHQTTQDSSMY